MIIEIILLILGFILGLVLSLLDAIYALLPETVTTSFTDALDSFDEVLDKIVPSGVVNEIVPLGTFIAALQTYLILRLVLEGVFFIWFALSVIPFFGVPNFENPKRYLSF